MSTPTIRRLARRGFMKSVSALHSAVYRASGGRVGGRMGGMPILLLTTTGRRSGKTRTNPLLYLSDGDAIVVVASNGGNAQMPFWWLNLTANPDATVELGGARSRVRARKAAPEERARLWPLFTARFAGYAKYEARTTREIPVVILEPASPA